MRGRKVIKERRERTEGQGERGGKGTRRGENGERREERREKRERGREKRGGKGGNGQNKREERREEWWVRREDRGEETSPTRPFPSSVEDLSGVAGRGHPGFPTPGMALEMLAFPRLSVHPSVCLTYLVSKAFLYFPIFSDTMIQQMRSHLDYLANFR